MEKIGKQLQNCQAFTVFYETPKTVLPRKTSWQCQKSGPLWHS